MFQSEITARMARQLQLRRTPLSQLQDLDPSQSADCDHVPLLPAAEPTEAALAFANSACPVCLVDRSMLVPGRAAHTLRLLPSGTLTACCSPACADLLLADPSAARRYRFTRPPYVPPPRLLLIGAAGAGKTLHGRQLAQRYGLVYASLATTLQPFQATQAAKLPPPTKSSSSSAAAAAASFGTHLTEAVASLVNSEIVRTQGLLLEVDVYQPEVADILLADSSPLCITAALHLHTASQSPSWLPPARAKVAIAAVNVLVARLSASQVGAPPLLSAHTDHLPALIVQQRLQRLAHVFADPIRRQGLLYAASPLSAQSHLEASVSDSSSRNIASAAMLLSSGRKSLSHRFEKRCPVCIHMQIRHQHPGPGSIDLFVRDLLRLL